MQFVSQLNPQPIWATLGTAADGSVAGDDVGP